MRKMTFKIKPTKLPKTTFGRVAPKGAGRKLKPAASIYTKRR